jgi:hypothetical protein
MINEPYINGFAPKKSLIVVSLNVYFLITVLGRVCVYCTQKKKFFHIPVCQGTLVEPRRLQASNAPSLRTPNNWQNLKYHSPIRELKIVEEP